MEKQAKIYVAGNSGMVGSAIIRELNRQGYMNIVVRSHKELDLCRQADVEKFFAEEKPEYVFLTAAKVGGIIANSESPADFMYDNMMIEMNVIHAAWLNGCKKLLFTGSSCIYPKFAQQPMKESCLLTSELEPTNEAYALAKISGLKYCEYLNRQYGADFITVMPTNIYGPNDNYHPTKSHVIPALIKRFHDAKIENKPSVTCWGDGSPLREFLYVDDLAEACVFLMNTYSGSEAVNIGTGKEISIKALTELIAEIVGYTGEILWDTSKPNGTPRKVVDTSKAESLGWKYKIELREGLRKAYEFVYNTPPIIKNDTLRKIGIGGVYVGESGRRYVNKALNAGRLSQGEMVYKFEKQFAELHEQKYGVALNSGTSALHVGLEAMKEKFGWRDGAKVIVPAITFIASSNSILHAGLTPTFVDVDARTYNLNPTLIEEAIDKDTVAIMPVHLFGQPCEMDPIVEIARRHGLKIIEDCAESHFATYKGKKVGSFGEVAGFSTYVAHTITTGVGGLVTTNDRELMEISRSLLAHGRACTCEKCVASDPRKVCPLRMKTKMDKRFMFVRLGYSYRIGELEGALGLDQIENRDFIMDSRRANAKYLTEKLSDTQEFLQLPWYPEYVEHSFMMYPIVIKDDAPFERRQLTEYLEKNNIETRPMMPLLNQPVYIELFGDIEKNYPVAQWINRSGFYVGCHHCLTQEELDKIVECIHEFLKGI